MKIGIVGVGAMGSVYAGLLGDAGNEVWAIDRWQDHVDAIREHGLRIEGASGDRTVAIETATSPDEVGDCELVIIATKAMDATAAAELARPLVADGTVVLSIQNGLGGPERVAEVLGEEPVAIGVVGGFGASIVAPGHVRHEGWELVRLGERSGPATPRVEEIADVWRAAGFKVQTYDDVGKLVWEKLVCNSTYSGPCTVLESTIGGVLDDPEAWAVASRCGSEAYETGVALGVSFGFDDPVEYVHAFGSKMRDARPSMLLDYLAGRRSEVDFINGAIPPLADSLGLGAETNRTVAQFVRAKERVRLEAG